MKNVLCEQRRWWEMIRSSSQSHIPLSVLTKKIYSCLQHFIVMIHESHEGAVNPLMNEFHEFFCWQLFMNASFMCEFKLFHVEHSLSHFINRNYVKRCQQKIKMWKQWNWKKSLSRGHFRCELKSSCSLLPLLVMMQSSFFSSLQSKMLRSDEMMRACHYENESKPFGKI